MAGTLQPNPKLEHEQGDQGSPDLNPQGVGAGADGEEDQGALLSFVPDLDAALEQVASAGRASL